MVEKIKPCAVISKYYDEDGRTSWYAIDYYCPTCGRQIRSYKSDNACDKCGTFYDWGKREPEIKITRSVEW